MKGPRGLTIVMKLGTAHSNASIYSLLLISNYFIRDEFDCR